MTLGGATIVRYAAGAALGAALLAAAGVGLGSLIRSQLAAVIGVFVWAFFVESIVGGLFNAIDPYLPFTAATTVAGSRPGGGGFGFAGSTSAAPLPAVVAAALVAGVTVLLSAVAARSTVPRDIS